MVAPIVAMALVTLAIGFAPDLAARARSARRRRAARPPRLLLAFMVAMALKLVAYRWAFWRSGWNVRH